MLRAASYRVVLTLAAGLLAGGPAPASAPLYVPLGAMVADAEAVAVVRIEAAEVIPLPPDRPKVWHPNRTLTLRPTDNVRGKLPESFTIRAEVAPYRNPSAVVGAEALVFLSATRAGTDGHLPAFEAAQGFLVVADLLPGGDAKARAAVRDALVAAVRAGRPAAPHGRTRDVKLTDAAMAPLLKLLEAGDPRVRRWAIERGLDQVHVSPVLARRLIALLADGDAGVAAAAALTLTRMNQRHAAAALQAYQPRIPAGKAFEFYAAEVRGTLRCWAVMDRVDAMPEALTGRVAAALGDRLAGGEHVALDLRYGDGVRLGHRDRGGVTLPDPVLADLREWLAGAPDAVRAEPFQVTLYLSRQVGGVAWEGQWHR